MSDKFHDDLSELHWKARGGLRKCGVSDDIGYGFYCTRETGHAGNHVAHDYSDQVSAAMVIRGYKQLVWGKPGEEHSHLNDLYAPESHCGAPGFGLTRTCTRRQGHGGDHLAHWKRSGTSEGVVCIDAGAQPQWWAWSHEQPQPGVVYQITAFGLPDAVNACKPDTGRTPCTLKADDAAYTVKLSKEALTTARTLVADVSPTMTDFSVVYQREALSLLRALAEMPKTSTMRVALMSRAARFIAAVGMTRQPADVRDRARKALSLLRPASKPLVSEKTAKRMMDGKL